MKRGPIQVLGVAHGRQERFKNNVKIQFRLRHEAQRGDLLPGFDCSASQARPNLGVSVVLWGRSAGEITGPY